MFHTCYIVLLQALAIAVAQAISPGYTCKFTTGDGIGGPENYVGPQVGSACVKRCVTAKKSDTTITGVTVYSDGRKGCWCEKMMDAVNPVLTEYKTCFIQVKAISPGYTCKFTTGDGTGGTENYVGHQTGSACVEICVTVKKSDTDINGVTVYSDGRRGCWCEKKMNKVNPVLRQYKTCFIKSKGACAFGNRKDGSGCCSIPICPMICLDNTQFVKGQDGCTKCVCGNCVNTKCPINCMHGTIKKTAGGCSCACRTCATVECPKSCVWGIETIIDGNGCLKCRCLQQQQRCDVLRCPSNCAYGNMEIYNEYGCKKCVCQDIICPTYNCPKSCVLGTEDVKDERGCTQCECVQQNVPAKPGPKKPHQPHG